MNAISNTVIELTKIITEFFSDNSFSIILLTLLIICRDSISNFISRLTSFSFKNGSSEVGMKATAPVKDDENRKIDLPSAIEKPAEQDEESELEGKVKEDNWLSETHKAFEEGRLEDAEITFKKYALNEKDEVKLEKNKALYLYFKFEKGKDNSAIQDLENLVRTAKTEESKFNSTEWLSFCLKDGMQYKKEIETWKNLIKEMESPTLKTNSIVNLAYALNKDDQTIPARTLLINRLTEVNEDEQKKAIFDALSTIEDSLGNKNISIYCKDKTLEYDPNNRDELFNSAHSASKENIDEICISNYLKLLRIDADNSAALNNLGVRAQEVGLEIKASEHYKKSASNKNTLAMANQGYLLLNAGFSEEADEISKMALECDDPHKNIFSLITAINEKKETQNSEWDKLGEKALNRQKQIRIYTEQFYLGNSKDLTGNWLTQDSLPLNVTIKKNELEATWQEPSANVLNGNSNTVKLSGVVSGSTFSGQLTRQNNTENSTSMLSLMSDTNKTCIGYIANGGEKFVLISPKLSDDFLMSLTRPKT